MERHFESESSALQWLAKLDGVADHARGRFLREVALKLRNKNDALALRRGKRQNHEQYLELRAHFERFVTNQVEPMKERLASLSTDDLRQMVSVTEGFLAMVSSFFWYPDITSVILALGSEFVFGLKLLERARTERKTERALVSLPWIAQPKGTGFEILGISISVVLFFTMHLN